MKLFLRKNIGFAKKSNVEESISCTKLFLWLCDCGKKQLFGGARESTCYYMIRKAFKIPAEKFIFQLGCSLQAFNVDTNELIHWYFSMILTTLGNFSQLLSDFQNNYLQNILGWLLLCAISNQTKENFATWQHMIFIYIKQSIDSNSFKFCRP